MYPKKKGCMERMGVTLLTGVLFYSKAASVLEGDMGINCRSHPILSYPNRKNPVQFPFVLTLSEVCLLKRLSAQETRIDWLVWLVLKNCHSLVRSQCGFQWCSGCGAQLSLWGLRNTFLTKRTSVMWWGH